MAKKKKITLLLYICLYGYMRNKESLILKAVFYDFCLDCHKNICNGHGTCHNNYFGHTCKCDNGYIGDNCGKGKLYIITNKYWTIIFFSTLVVHICYLRSICDFNLCILYCQIYTIWLNTSLTTYMKFSLVPYQVIWGGGICRFL